MIEGREMVEVVEREVDEIDGEVVSDGSVMVVC